MVTKRVHPKRRYSKVDEDGIRTWTDQRLAHMDHMCVSTATKESVVPQEVGLVYANVEGMLSPTDARRVAEMLISAADVAEVESLCVRLARYGQSPTPAGDVSEPHTIPEE